MPLITPPYPYYDTRLKKPMTKENLAQQGITKENALSAGVYTVYSQAEESDTYKLLTGTYYGEPQEDGFIALLGTYMNRPESSVMKVLKAEKLAEINAEYTEQADLLKIGTPMDEVLTWDIQRLEAQAWRKDNTVPTPNADALALARGVTRVELLEKIHAKAEAYEALIFKLTGQRQKYEDAIKAATTIEAVQAIVWADEAVIHV